MEKKRGKCVGCGTEDIHQEDITSPTSPDWCSHKRLLASHVVDSTYPLPARMYVVNPTTYSLA